MKTTTMKTATITILRVMMFFPTIKSEPHKRVKHCTETIRLRITLSTYYIDPKINKHKINYSLFLDVPHLIYW